MEYQVTQRREVCLRRCQQPYVKTTLWVWRKEEAGTPKRPQRHWCKSEYSGRMPSLRSWVFYAFYFIHVNRQKLSIPFKAKKESLSDAYHNSLYAEWWFLFQEKHCMLFLIALPRNIFVWFSFLCQQITSLNRHLESWPLPSRFLLCLTSLSQDIYAVCMS